MKVHGFRKEWKARRAVSEILAALILFSAIFVTGTGVYLYVNSTANSANQANATNADAGLEAAQEKLNVTTGYSTGSLWAEATNTGGGSISILGLYVTNQSSQLVSKSVAPSYFGYSHFLNDSSDLSGASFPLTLAVGASTPRVSINPLSCTACGLTKYVVVSFLTSVGNIFSAQYPPPPIPVFNEITAVNDSASGVLYLLGGGPQLNVLIRATATGGTTQTFSCYDGCITVNATVYNLAATPASNVNFTLHTPYSEFVSGTASVAPYNPVSPCGPPIPSIAPGGHASFICKFNADTGHSGGLAAFSGHVTATVFKISITSSEALSNSIEIGGLASVTTQGAFVPDFYFLRYSSCVQDTGTNFQPSSGCTTNVPITKTTPVSNLPSGSFIAGGSNFYTAFYLRITNVFNTSLPITQYSYTFGDPTVSGEVYYFLAGSNATMTEGGHSVNSVYYPNYTTTLTHPTPTLTSYPTDCRYVYTAGSEKGRPIDSECIYVNPGQTVTLTFAACGYNASTWAWAGTMDAGEPYNRPGCTGYPPGLTVPEGMVLGIVVSFLYKGEVYSQLMPFEAQAYLRSTRTQVSCWPNPVGAGNPSSCTATVQDTDGYARIPSLTTPIGTVTFSGEALTYGTVSSPTCTLSSGSCTVTYTPYTGTESPPPVILNATYGGDSYHSASAGGTTLTVLHPTSTSVACSPSTLMVNTETNCVVTVRDTGITPTAPTGTVGPYTYWWWEPSWPYWWSSSTSACSLSPINGSSASCSFTFTPALYNEGSRLVYAPYGGDSTHVASTGVTSVTATERNSATTVTCKPSPVSEYGATVCTAKVTDISPGTASTPYGTVVFYANPNYGTFPRGNSCNGWGGCSVVFSPNVPSGTINITAHYLGNYYNYNPSWGWTLITVTPPVTGPPPTMTVTCNPTSLPPYGTTTCIVTVTDSGSETGNPTGIVSWSDNASIPGSYQWTPCLLTSVVGNSNSAHCTVNYIPKISSGTILIIAHYTGDTTHPPNTATTTITVVPGTRKTTTSVSCPSSIAFNSTGTCTIKVTDSDSGTKVTPTGSVSITSSPLADGSLSASSCTLTGSGATASCTVQYTPSVTSGGITLSANYPGDSAHKSSSGYTTFSASKRSVTVTMACNPQYSASTVCVVTVTDNSGGTQSIPAGTISFSASPSGGSFSSPTCTLSATGPYSAGCDVSFSGSGTGSFAYTIYASYSGDTYHVGGSTSAIFNFFSVF